MTTVSWSWSTYRGGPTGTTTASSPLPTVTNPAPVPAPAPVSIAPTLPDPSLAGQAWGWPIPITAGNRPGLPGRPVRRRLTKLGVGNFVLDALISFGWRAEIMGGFSPANFDATKLLANGVVIWEKDVMTFPGGTVTIFDGLQTSFVWADIDGGNAQGYIYHILADVRGLPLAQFNGAVPDSWSLHCEDVAGSSSFTGIRPAFGTAHHTTVSLSTTSTASDTATNAGTGTALSLDRLPPGKTCWKIYVPTAGTDSRLGISQELLAGDPNLATTPGFGTSGIVLKRDGSLYDGFPRPGPGLTWGSGSYILQAYDSTTGKWWLGSTNAGGTSVIWYGDPSAGTGASGIMGFGAFPHAALFGSGGEVFQFLQPVASEIPVGFTAYSPDPSGITLARWFQLAAGLSTDLKGKVTVSTNIDDVLDSFFFVDGQSTFNRDAMAMCEIAGCYMREDNNAIYIGRGVNGTDYAVDLAVPTRRLLRAPGESAIQFTKIAQQDLPSEVRVQSISSERADKFTERPARWERGPKPTSVSTKIESFRVQAGMTVNQMQTYASRTLDRKTEARDKAAYKLPWQDAIAVQPGNIQTIPEDDRLYTLQVISASREANRIVAIDAITLHTAQDYQGLADIGTGYASPIALPTVDGVITGSIAPVGSLHGVFLAEDDGVIVGSMSPVGSLNATVSVPGATGTITGSMSPTGSLSGTFTSAAPFALTDLANLQALWDADSIAGADNSSIGATSIIDSSGNGRNSTASSSAATLRTAFINGHNAIRATGSGNYYDVANFMSGYTQGTMFWVAKTDADNSTNAPPFNWTLGSGGSQHYPYSDNHIYSSAGTTVRKDAGAAGSGVLNAWHIVTVRSASGLWEFRLNGSVLFTTATNTVGFTTTPHFFTENGTSGFLGHAAVIGLYSTSYSQSDCEKIEGLLAHRYGLTSVLPIGHPYKSTPP